MYSNLCVGYVCVYALLEVAKFNISDTIHVLWYANMFN